jgi:hypothetical protein
LLGRFQALELVDEGAKLAQTVANLLELCVEEVAHMHSLSVTVGVNVTVK